MLENTIKWAYTRFIQKNPFFATILFYLQLKEDPTIMTIGTDGENLFYNKNFLQTTIAKTGNRDVLVSIFAHEVLHIALKHIIRRGNRDIDIYNEACDYVVNSLLKNIGFTEIPGWLYESRFDGMSVEEVYEILIKEREKQYIAQNKSSQNYSSSTQSNDTKCSNNSSQPGSNNSEDPSVSPENHNQNSSGTNNVDNSQSNNACSSFSPSGGNKNNSSSSDNNGTQESPTTQNGNQISGSGVDSNQSGTPSRNNASHNTQNTSGSQSSHNDKDNSSQSSRQQRGLDNHDEWKNVSAKEKNQIEKKLNDIIVRASEAAKIRGNLPAGLKRIVEDIINPKVDWRSALNVFLQPVRCDYQYNPPDRRFLGLDDLEDEVILPDFGEKGIEDIVIAIDTSGSISDAQLSQFMTEIKEILSAYTSVRGYLVLCDADINGWYEISSEMTPINIEVHGGGGTDFKPVFNEIAKRGINPCGLVYLTDGDGYYPTSPPPYPVMWVLTKSYHVEPPWGLKTEIDLV